MRMRTLLVVAIGVAPWIARAQEAPPAGACASIQSDSERLACYDRAVRATPAPPPSTTATPPAPSPAPTAVAAPAQVSAQPSPSTLSTAPRTSPRNARAPAPQAAPAVEPPAAAPVGVVPIVVLGTRALPGRGVEFTTDRGEVWVQTDTQPLQLPPTPFNAEIKRGTLGSVFLVPENRLGIRVRHPN